MGSAWTNLRDTSWLLATTGSRSAYMNRVFPNSGAQAPVGSWGLSVVAFPGGWYEIRDVAMTSPEEK